jgi:hypothetical protein
MHKFVHVHAQTDMHISPIPMIERGQPASFNIGYSVGQNYQLVVIL